MQRQWPDYACPSDVRTSPSTAINKDKLRIMKYKYFSFTYLAELAHNESKSTDVLGRHWVHDSLNHKLLKYILYIYTWILDRKSPIMWYYSLKHRQLPTLPCLRRKARIGSSTCAVRSVRKKLLPIRENGVNKVNMGKRTNIPIGVLLCVLKKSRLYFGGDERRLQTILIT